ncbi:MAG: hypothetical protein RMI35_07430 [Leptospiraceae bacterium]|nr:hypothetical protein [Leptospiraceae bacterium]
MYFLKRNKVSFLILVLILILYLFFHFVLTHFIQREILFVLFSGVVLFLLFTIKDYVSSYHFVGFNWDDLMGSEFHHFEFLSGNFSLKDVIEKITPELMIWLKIPEARLFILNPDRKSFTMYLYHKGKIENVHLIPKRRIFYITKFARRYQEIIHLNITLLREEEIRLLKKFNVYIVVPFFHFNKFMGFISFHHPTRNPHANKALELYATKVALLIHYEILKARMQNITQYEEEIKVAEKVRKMLQTYQLPNIPHFEFYTSNIYPACIMEGVQIESDYYLILLSTPKVDGVSAMILSGKLGYLYAYIQQNREALNPKNILQFLSEKNELDNDNYPIEALILKFSYQKDYILPYCKDNRSYYFRKSKNKLYRITNEEKIFLEKNVIYELFYKTHYLLGIEFKGL